MKSKKMIAKMRAKVKPTTRKPQHKCVVCERVCVCRRYRRKYFCRSCIKVEGKIVAMVKCPRHKNWCSDTNPCPGCIADWFSDAGYY